MGKLILKILQKIFGKKPPQPKQPPTHSKPGCTVGCKLSKPAKRPVRRHDPCKTRGNDPTKEANTMLDPDFDISSDLDALNRGNFTREGEDYIVGQRRYGYHPDTGTVFPKSGPGTIQVSRAQHQLLKQLNSGSYENAMKFAKNFPGLSQEDIGQVLEIWEKCKK